MTLPKNLGHTLLAVYLVGTGFVGLTHITLGVLPLLLAIVALLAGICLFVGK